MTHFAQTPGAIHKSEHFQALTPNEFEHYNHLRTTVILRLFHFTILLIEKFPTFQPPGLDAEEGSQKSKKQKKEKLSSINWFGGYEGTSATKFFQLLVSSVLCPTAPKLGFSFDELETNPSIPSAAPGASKQPVLSQQSQPRYTWFLLRIFQLILLHRVPAEPSAPSLRQLTTRLIKLLLKKMPEANLDVFKTILKRNLNLPQNNLLSVDFMHTSTYTRFHAKSLTGDRLQCTANHMPYRRLRAVTPVWPSYASLCCITCQRFGRKASDIGF